MFWVSIRYNMQKRVCLMKWFASLLIAAAGLIAMSLPATFAASSAAVTIESISHNVGSETNEKLTFKLSARIEAKIFTMKGDNPRLVIDFPNSTYAGKGVVSLADGKLATTIRTGFHQSPEQKTRVVVDLAKQIPVRYTSEYSEADNTLTILLSSDGEEQSKKEVSPPVKQEAITHTPPPPEVVTKSMEEKLVPPVFPPQEPAKKNVPMLVTPATAVTNAQNSQLLDISFDDSSNRGEMVLFHLTNFHPPMVSAMEKDNPRVFCDFVGMELGKGVEVNIAAKGKYVEHISTSKQSKPDKIRVVLNLSPHRDYDLQQVFFKNDNLFVLIVNELPAEKSAQ
jgi:hypothetical protein